MFKRPVFTKGRMTRGAGRGLSNAVSSMDCPCVRGELIVLCLGLGGRPTRAPGPVRVPGARVYVEGANGYCEVGEGERTRFKGSSDVPITGESGTSAMGPRVSEGGVADVVNTGGSDGGTLPLRGKIIFCATCAFDICLETVTIVAEFALSGSDSTGDALTGDSWELSLLWPGPVVSPDNIVEITDAVPDADRLTSNERCHVVLCAARIQPRGARNWDCGVFTIPGRLRQRLTHLGFLNCSRHSR